MIALISPAKTMRSGTTPYSSEPRSLARFPKQTHHIVSLMLRYNVAELQDIFRVSAPIARELQLRFNNFFGEDNIELPAVESYDGVVYKHFKEEREFTPSQKSYLQEHLRISSLLYGILRPFDLITPYRMEGFVRLAGSDERVDRHWRDIQTSTLIGDVRLSGGTLLYLASKEERNAFNWREVKKSVRVIDFEFLQHKGDKLRQVVIYTKMARGEMIRYMIQNSITDPEQLKAFEWGGYRYCEELSTPDVWKWVL